MRKESEMEESDIKEMTDIIEAYAKSDGSSESAAAILGSGVGADDHDEVKKGIEKMFAVIDAAIGIKSDAEKNGITVALNRTDRGSTPKGRAGIEEAAVEFIDMLSEEV